MPSPVRVLHLIDGQRPGGGPCAMRMAADVIAATQGFAHEVIIIGTRAHVELAQRCGLAPSGSFAPVRPRAGTSDYERAQLLDRLGNVSYRADVVQYWNTLEAAPWGDWRVRRWGEQWSEAFADRDRIRGVLAVNPEGLVARVEIRARWQDEHGIGAHEFVIGLLGEPVEALDACAAVQVASRLILTGRPVRLVIAPPSARRAEAERFMRDVGFCAALMQDEALAEPWRVVAGLDAAIDFRFWTVDFGLSLNERGGIHDRRRTEVAQLPIRNSRSKIQDHQTSLATRSFGALPLLWAFAAGVPVVGVGQDRDRASAVGGRPFTSRDRAPNDAQPQTCLLVPAGDLHAMTRALARLFDDEPLRERLTTSARHFVTEHCAPAAAGEAFAQAWRAALSE